MLRGAGLAPALVAAGGSVAAAVLTPGTANAEVLSPLSRGERRAEAFRIRRDAARDNRQRSRGLGRQQTNDDDDYPDARGSFTKALPHDAIGEVDPSAYHALRYAMESGDPDDFDLIPLDPAADRRLANPQAALAFSMTGLDSHFGRMPPAPSFTSLKTAAEMGELYWAALTREVPFRHYGSDALVGQALTDLNAFTKTVGPKSGGQVTAGTFLRGETPADLVGPFLSQLLWKPVTFGLATIEQRYPVPIASDFMTDFGSWLQIQRGAAPPAGITYDPVPRYLYNGRGLGEYVHVDQSYQAYLFGALILLGYGGAALSAGNPYLAGNQGGFITHGGAEILDLVAKAASLGLKAAWFQKWAAHRRLRPEAYGGRLQVQLDGIKDYGLPAEITGSAAIAMVQMHNGNALLPQAFPEGSPTHPAYPAGHATIAGACSTVLKAVFDEDFVFPDPVQATSDGMALDPWAGAGLTLGGEVNKLAANVSLARDTAGVHYRSDSIDGLALGEQVALAMLADDTRTYNEDFGGYELTTFDGQSVLVVDGEIHTL
ncbi:MAG: vanadium-dependent haloperoxidase [Myxococcota bacterium]